MGRMTTTMAYHAASRGIEIEAIDTESDGDIDLRGYGLSDKIRGGHRNIRVRMRVKSKANPETLRELAKFSRCTTSCRTRCRWTWSSRPIDVRGRVADERRGRIERHTPSDAVRAVSNGKRVRSRR